VSTHLEAEALDVRPSAWQFLWCWLQIGLQSFGGGAATLYLIRRATIEERHWISESEFTRCWAICQLTPGINLMAMTVLLGWRIRGWLGVFLSMFGLLLPSVSITIMLAAFYTSVREQPLVQQALQGIIPATVGLGFLLVLRLARPILKESKQEGPRSLATSIILLVSSGTVFALFHPPVMVLLWICGGIGAYMVWRNLR
jgi:chromate transporter